jgi:hypothetical protein
MARGGEEEMADALGARNDGVEGCGDESGRVKTPTP